MMRKYRKLPVVIGAVRFSPADNDVKYPGVCYLAHCAAIFDYPHIHTLEGR